MTARTTGKALSLRVATGIALMAACAVGLWLLHTWMMSPLVITGSERIVALTLQHYDSITVLVKAAWILGMAVLAGVVVRHWAAVLVLPVAFWLAVGVLAWALQDPATPWQATLPWNVISSEEDQSPLGFLILVVVGGTVGLLAGRATSRRPHYGSQEPPPVR